MERDFNNRVHRLKEEFGNFYFFAQALEKQIVTRQIVVSAQSKNSWTKFARYLFSGTLIGIGLVTYHPSQLTVSLFLIPAGFVIFWFYQIRLRREKNAIEELSKLATGIHARKLERHRFVISE